MRTLERNTTMPYARLIRVYFITFIVVLSSALSLLIYSYFQKEASKEQIIHINELKTNLSELDRNVIRQLSDGFLNIHDVFIEFGNFQDQNVSHIGIDDFELLDSLANVGDLFKYFNSDPEQKHKIEIIKNLNKIDELLLKTDEHSLNEKVESIQTLSKNGQYFKNDWSLYTHLLERSYIQSIHDHEIKIEKNKRAVYLTAIFCIGILTLFILYLCYIFQFKIIKSLNTLKKNISLLSQGSNPDTERDFLNGEFNDIQFDIENVYKNYKQTDEILSIFYSEKNISDLDLEKFKSNVFYESVSKLRSQLKSLETEEKNRNWNLNGISQLTEITNKFSGEPKKLFEQFLIAIVQYIGAVQGGIFVKETDDLMSLEASYAFDRLKKKTRVLSKGEGLLGEVWLEEKTQYIENIPPDHFFVSSSLGESIAVSVIIVPLIERGECFGVIELSAFKNMDQHTQTFIIKACEILSSATANVKVNQKTKQLLRDTQFLAEKLKNQEDENIRKIQDLKEQIEKEQHRLYIKDVEIKTKKMLYDQSCEAIEKLNEQIKKQNESFELQLTQASTNSDFVNNLKSQNELLTKEIVDLKETIHIRNIKIERMKKKLDSSN